MSDTDTISTAITTLQSYAAHCHDEVATAGGVVVKAYEALAKELVAMRAEGAEQLAALELALPILEKYEPCGYYCDEDHGHIDYPATYAVFRAINHHPLGATLLADLDRLTQSHTELRGTVEMMTEALLGAEGEVAALRAERDEARLVITSWLDGSVPKDELEACARSFLAALRGEVG